MLPVPDQRVASGSPAEPADALKRHVLQAHFAQATGCTTEQSQLLLHEARWNFEVRLRSHHALLDEHALTFAFLCTCSSRCHSSSKRQPSPASSRLMDAPASIRCVHLPLFDPLA